MSLKLEEIGGDLSLLPFITLIMVYNGHREISLVLFFAQKRQALAATWPLIQTLCI